MKKLYIFPLTILGKKNDKNVNNNKKRWARRRNFAWPNRGRNVYLHYVFAPTKIDFISASFLGCLSFAGFKIDKERGHLASPKPIKRGTNFSEFEESYFTNFYFIYIFSSFFLWIRINFSFDGYEHVIFRRDALYRRLVLLTTKLSIIWMVMVSKRLHGFERFYCVHENRDFFSPWGIKGIKKTLFSWERGSQVDKYDSTMRFLLCNLDVKVSPWRKQRKFFCQWGHLKRILCDAYTKQYLFQQKEHVLIKAPEIDKKTSKSTTELNYLM